MVNGQTVNKIDQVLDTKGTRCPIPVIRAKQALKKLAVNQILKVLSTDPSSKDDFDAMLQHVPHSLVAFDTEVDNGLDVFVFLIRKG